MRAAGLVCLGAGAGLIRSDLREVRGTDVACRSGGVVVTVGARRRGRALCRCWPATTAGCWPRPWSPGDGLVLRGTDPGRRNLANPLAAALDGGERRLDTSLLARDLAGRLRGAARAGHLHARRRDHLLPAAR